MMFSWPLVISFFSGVFMVAWLLYPSDYFMGLMHRQQPDRAQAIESFQKYLVHRPYNKQATLALAEVYESVADPEAALALLKNLYEHRRGDWEIGRQYLELLERSGHLALAQAFRWQLYEDLTKQVTTQKNVLEEILYRAYEQALLTQDQEGQISALEALAQHAKNPESYRYEIIRHYAQSRNFAKMTALLKIQRIDKPSDPTLRMVLAETYRVQGRMDAALQEIAQALDMHPDHPGFLEQRAGIYESQKRYARALKDLTRLAELRPENKSMQRRLAYALLQSGQFQEALALYRGLTERYPQDKQCWQELISVYIQRQMHEEAIDWLKRFTQRFPGSAWGYDELAALLNQLERWEEAQALYRKLIERNPQSHKQWWELFYSYTDHGQNKEAIELLQAYLKLHPAQEKAARQLSILLTDAKLYEEARAIALKWHEHNPENPEWLLQLAQLNASLGNSKEATGYYKRWMAMVGEKPETLKEVGRESFFAGELDLARRLLSSAHGLNPGDWEIPFYLSEVEFALDNDRAGRAWAGQALEAIPKDSNPEVQRKKLKLEARLFWNDQFDKRYRALAQSQPKDLQILQDWMDVLLGHGADASEPLSLHLERFPEKSGPDLRRALAESYLRLGHWRQAETILSRLARDPEHSPETRTLLRELHESYDHYAGPLFRFYRLPEETSYEAGLSYRGPISDKLRLEADWAHGLYQVPAKGFERNVSHFTTRFGLYRPGLNFGLVAGGSAGGLNNRFSSGAFLHYRREDVLSVETEYRYRRFLNEFAQAVSAGALADETKTQFEFKVFKQVYLNAYYQYNHYQTTAHKAWRHQVRPGAAYVFKDVPYLAASYQFAYDQVDGESGFFQQLPLIRRARTHYAGFSYGHKWSPVLGWDVYVYNGEDSGRNLSFFRGDIFGFVAALRLSAREWLDVAPSYEYGREAISGLTGQSHTVFLRLQAHWYGKKNLSHR